MIIKKESIEALKARVDIVDLVGSYLELRRSGTSYMARCPFHEEKTASFSVNPKGFYYCFGCQAKGDAIGFVQNYEHLSFAEAAQKIADQYNFALEYEQGSAGKKRDYRPLEALKKFFIGSLSRNAEAREYLRSRGLSDATIEKFEIGLAPESGLQLDFLRAEKIPFDAAIEAGVVIQDETGRYYARFTKRVMFPIYSHSGAIVGFGGRTLTNHPAKYINSPQSEFFNKSRTLYALTVARDAILREKTAIVCEGYMDAVALHQAGFSNAIATLGTALTSEHLPLLKRLDDPKIVLSYDGDAAGQEAAFKASRLLAAHNFRGGVARYSGGKDPAELVASGKIHELAQAYEKLTPFAKYALEQIIDRAPNPDAAFEAAREFLDSLSDLAFEAARGYAAAKLGLDQRRFRRRSGGGFQSDRAVSLLSGRHDLGELALIKTLALDRELFADLIDYLDAALFTIHRPLYDALLNGDDAALNPLLVEDRVAVWNANEAREAVRQLSKLFLDKEIRRLRADGESARMKEAQIAIVALSKGKILPFRRF